MTDLHPENALLAAWERTLRTFNERPAIFATDGSALRTFRAIEDEARTVTSLVRSFAPGAVVGLQIGNSPSWPAVLLTLFRAALIPLPLGRHMAAAELELALTTCGVAALIICDHGELRIDCRNASSRKQNVWPDRVPHFLKLTSGTTSAPRAIRFHVDQLLADCENICETMDITKDDVSFGAIPFSHSYGFSNLITPLIVRGVSLVASEDRLPRAMLEDLSRTGATVFPGMPVFFQNFVELENIPPLRRLRLCVSAGAPLNAEIATRFTAKFERKIHTFYGASECGGIAYDPSMALIYEDGFIGEAMRNVEVRRAEGNEPAAISVHSAAVGDGYFPESDQPVLGRGRFVPSDLIRWSERGMFIAGRASDVINVAGRKLNPLEVEQRLLTCDGVKQAIVFGIPSPLRGEEPIACIVAEETVNAADVYRFCNAQLSVWQIPKDIWVVQEIPANERGKISRRILAERYLDERARRRSGTPEMPLAQATDEPHCAGGG